VKDNRITVWTNTTTHSTGSTTNTGPTIDLYASGAPVGGTYWGTDKHGVGVQIIQSRASGTGQTTVWEWEVSSDDSTWRKGGFIGLGTMDAAGVVDKFRSLLPTQYRYCRLLATNSGTGTSTSVAYVEDLGGMPGTIAAPDDN